jgi:hypothetical protein
MSNVVSYTQFFFMRELQKHIKQFESEGNEESVKKLKKILRNNLTSINSSAIQAGGGYRDDIYTA